MIGLIPLLRTPSHDHLFQVQKFDLESTVFCHAINPVMFVHNQLNRVTIMKFEETA
jgi:hypothetical protein